MRKRFAQVLKLSLSLLALLLFVCGPANSSEVLIAVLEQPQCKDYEDVAVRLLFSKQDDTWGLINAKSISAKNALNKINWTMAFNGKTLGKVKIVDTSKEKTSDWFSRGKIYKIAPETKTYRIKNKENNFTGWCSSPKFRPIVLVSESNFKDPSAWKPFQPPEKILNPVKRYFREKYETAPNCVHEPSFQVVPFEYKETDILNHKSYRSISHEYLISLQVNPELNHCDGAESEESQPWWINWFFVNKKAHIVEIGTGLEVVDAGDYDKDGKAEVLFWYSGYNEDGYILYFDDFQKHVSFLWKYH